MILPWRVTERWFASSAAHRVYKKSTRNGPLRVFTFAVLIVTLANCGGGADTGEARSRATVEKPTSTSIPTAPAIEVTAPDATTTTTLATATLSCTGLDFPMCPAPAPKYFESEFVEALPEEISNSQGEHALLYSGDHWSDRDGDGNQWYFEELEYWNEDAGCATLENGLVIASDVMATVRGDANAHICQLTVANGAAHVLRVFWHEDDHVWWVNIGALNRDDGTLSPYYNADDLIEAIDAWMPTGVAYAPL
jgi:hypothetical protein